MRGLKILLTAAAVIAAAPVAHAQDITLRGRYTEKNIGALFQALHKHRGKNVIMNVQISVPEKGKTHDVRTSHCWVQIIDRKSKRVIEFFNVRDYESGPLTMKWSDLWEIQNIGNGGRKSSCGADPKGVEAPSPGYTYFLNPVG